MSTVFADEWQGDIRVVVASNGESEYVLWQFDLKDPGHVYFEFDDQLNGGYNIVDECHVDECGCHIALQSDILVDIYWNPPRHSQLKAFVDALGEIYPASAGVLEVRIGRKSGSLPIWLKRASLLIDFGTAPKSATPLLPPAQKLSRPRWRRVDNAT